MQTRAGQLLRQARTQARLTQRELARLGGIAPTLVSAYENGRRQPAADTLLRLLEAAGSRLQVRSTVADSRPAARELEQVCALAMALPRRDPGPLRFPAFRSLTAV